MPVRVREPDDGAWEVLVGTLQEGLRHYLYPLGAYKRFPPTLHPLASRKLLPFSLSGLSVALATTEGGKCHASPMDSKDPSS